MTVLCWLQEDLLATSAASVTSLTKTSPPSTATLASTTGKTTGSVALPRPPRLSIVLPRAVPSNACPQPRAMMSSTGTLTTPRLLTCQSWSRDCYFYSSNLFSTAASVEVYFFKCIFNSSKIVIRVEGYFFYALFFRCEIFSEYSFIAMRPLLVMIYIFHYDWPNKIIDLSTFSSQTGFSKWIISPVIYFICIVGIFLVVVS